MNENDLQQVTASSIPRYAHKPIYRSRRNSNALELSNNFRQNDFSTVNDKSPRDEIIHLSPQHIDLFSEATPQQLNQLAALYPCKLNTSIGNVVRNSEDVTPYNTIPKLNSPQHVIYQPTLVEPPQSYHPSATPKYLQAFKKMPAKPLYVQRATCVKPSPIFATTVVPITRVPPIRHYLLKNLQTSTKPLSVISSSTTITTTPTTTTTHIIPATTPLIATSTTESTTIPTATTIAPPITSTALSDSHKRSRLFIKNAFIVVGAQSEDVIAIERSLKNVNNTKSDKKSVNQLKLSHLIQSLLNKLGNGISDYDYADDDDENNYQGDSVDFRDDDGNYDDETDTKCHTGIDLFEACEGLSKTIISYRKSSQYLSIKPNL